MKAKFEIPSLKDHTTDLQNFCLATDLSKIDFINQNPQIKIVEFSRDFAEWTDLIRLKHVEELVFSYCYKLDQTFFRLLPQLPFLRKVTFHGCEHLDSRFFHEFANWEDLESLHLSGCSDLDHNLLQFLPNLRQLKISCCFALDDQGAGALSKLENLEVLELDLTEELSVKGLEALCKLPRLERLDLDDCSGIISFSPLRKLGNLKSLRLGGARHFNNQWLKTLEELELSSSTISGRGLKELVRLQRLDLSGCRFSPSSEVIQLPPRLTWLSVDVLPSFELCENLKHLKVRSFENLSAFPNLTCLELPYSRMEVEFSTLRSLQQLEELDLEGSDPLCLEALADLPHLRKVNASYCSLQNASLKEIGRVSSLQELNLAKCHELSDEGAAHLKGLKNLRKLDLRSTSFTEQGIFAMHPLDSLEELFLDLAGIKFSQEALREFFKIFPKLKLIDFGGYRLKSENFILNTIRVNPRVYQLLSPG